MLFSIYVYLLLFLYFVFAFRMEHNGHNSGLATMDLERKIKAELCVFFHLIYMQCVLFDLFNVYPLLCVFAG